MRALEFCTTHPASLAQPKPSGARENVTRDNHLGRQISPPLLLEYDSRISTMQVNHFLRVLTLLGISLCLCSFGREQPKVTTLQQGSARLLGL
jgi:hypothetical protein